MHAPICVRNIHKVSVILHRPWTFHVSLVSDVTICGAPSCPDCPLVVCCRDSVSPIGLAGQCLDKHRPLRRSQRLTGFWPYTLVPSAPLTPSLHPPFSTPPPPLSLPLYSLLSVLHSADNILCIFLSDRQPSCTRQKSRETLYSVNTKHLYKI